MTEWIDLYDHKTGKAESSWIRAIGWSNNSIIVRRYENDPTDFEVYKYEPVDKHIFSKIKDGYERGESVGSLVNKHIIQNKDVPEAVKADV